MRPYSARTCKEEKNSRGTCVVCRQRFIIEHSDVDTLRHNYMGPGQKPLKFSRADVGRTIEVLTDNRSDWTCWFFVTSSTETSFDLIVLLPPSDKAVQDQELQRIQELFRQVLIVGGTVMLPNHGELRHLPKGYQFETLDGQTLETTKAGVFVKMGLLVEGKPFRTDRWVHVCDHPDQLFGEIALLTEEQRQHLLMDLSFTRGRLRAQGLIAREQRKHLASSASVQ
jgi:hypothetical protein